MRTLTVLLLAGAIYSCSLLADMRAYTVTWDANTDDATSYNLFTWTGQDTTQCPFVNGLKLLNNDPNFEKSVPGRLTTEATFVVESNGIDYVAAALNAQDAAGKISGITLATVVDKPSSNFLLTIDETAPDDPGNVKIQ